MNYFNYCYKYVTSISYLYNYYLQITKIVLIINCIEEIKYVYTMINHLTKHV